MITHENLIEAVEQSNGAWSCPDGGELCKASNSCIECHEKLVIEYENSLREEGAREYRNSLPKSNIAEHDSEVLQKFAEWFKENHYYLCYNESIDEVIAKYEKEQKRGT